MTAPPAHPMTGPIARPISGPLARPMTGPDTRTLTRTHTHSSTHTHTHMTPTLSICVRSSRAGRKPHRAINVGRESSFGCGPSKCLEVGPPLHSCPKINVWVPFPARTNRQDVKTLTRQMRNVGADVKSAVDEPVTSADATL